MARGKALGLEGRITMQVEGRCLTQTCSVGQAKIKARDLRGKKKEELLKQLDRRRGFQTLEDVSELAARVRGHT